jgi:hypothetical protein
MEPQYSTQKQKPPQNTSHLPRKKSIQEVINVFLYGVFLYYGCAIDPTMLTVLSMIASAQAEPMEDTMMRCNQFLDYAATHQDAIITYNKSDMALVVHSDAYYLSKPKARGCAGWRFFMSFNVDDPINNGAILNLAQLIKVIMSSTAEAKLGALYINASEAIPHQQTLKEMGHKQPPTLMQTHNTTALGIVNNNIQPRCTKAMDMQFHWLRCREVQDQFQFCWHPGPTNKADYWTSINAQHTHHIEKRHKFLTQHSVLEAIRTSLNCTPAHPAAAAA